MTKKPIKVILDVDTGSDDAVAIITAILRPELQVEAICSVNGNVDIDHTTDNTLRVVQALGADVPVYRGCAAPMVRDLVPNRLPKMQKDPVVDGKALHMHETVLNLPAPTIREQEMPATLFYIDYLKHATEKVTLIPVGPLTNLGHAFRIAPEIVKNVEKIVIMGGGDHVSNVTGCAEFNIWQDAEAAQIVLKSGAPILWVSLDATHTGCLTLDDCARFREINTLASNFTAELVEHRIKVHNAGQPLDVPDAAAVHDALAVCAVIDESVLTDIRDVHLEVALNDYGEGETIVDRREKPDAPNCRFAYVGDRHRFARMLEEAFLGQK